jgi:hypothetical protein
MPEGGGRLSGPDVDQRRQGRLVERLAVRFDHQLLEALLGATRGLDLTVELRIVAHGPVVPQRPDGSEEPRLELPVRHRDLHGGPSGSTNVIRKSDRAVVVGIDQHDDTT